MTPHSFAVLTFGAVLVVRRVPEVEWVTTKTSHLNIFGQRGTQPLVRASQICVMNSSIVGILP